MLYVKLTTNNNHIFKYKNNVLENLSYFFNNCRNSVKKVNIKISSLNYLNTRLFYLYFIYKWDTHVYTRQKGLQGSAETLQASK